MPHLSLKYTAPFLRVTSTQQSKSLANLQDVRPVFPNLALGDPQPVRVFGPSQLTAKKSTVLLLLLLLMGGSKNLDCLRVPKGQKHHVRLLNI